MRQRRLPIMPPQLAPGDCIGIAAPASHIPREYKDYLERGLARVRNMGFKVKYASDLPNRKHLYLAGRDEERGEELMSLFLDPEVKGILCMRGGYGAQRVIPYLDPEVIRRNPKPLVGCSDITVLLIYLLEQCSIVPFHGPNIATRDFVQADDETVQDLARALTAAHPPAKIACRVLRSGEAHGGIVGGCLSSLVTTLGTAYEPNLQGKVFFTEDVNEPPYKIDRMLTHLKAAGKLAGVQGFIFGQMPGCDMENGLLTEVILDVLKESTGPILFGFPSGHGTRNLTIPLGVQVAVRDEVVIFSEEG
jgi:muramoyltetrapeptide carboxypeptidase